MPGPIFRIAAAFLVASSAVQPAAAVVVQSPAPLAGPGVFGLPVLSGLLAPISRTPSFGPLLPVLSPSVVLPRLSAAPALHLPSSRLPTHARGVGGEGAAAFQMPAAARPTAFATLESGALRALAASRRSADSAEAVADFQFVFDGSGLDFAMDPSGFPALDAEVEALPVVFAAAPEASFADEAMFVFGEQGRLLGAVQRALRNSGYDAAKTSAERAVLLDRAFGSVLTGYILKGPESVPSPGAYDAAIETFAQLRRVAKESSAAYPELRFEDNYILKASFHAVGALGEKVGSMEEYGTAVRAIADGALERSFAEPAYYEHALATMYDFFLRGSDAERGAEIRTPADLAARYAAGLAKLEAEGRGLAPSDEAFASARALARGLNGIVKAIADAAGTDLELAMGGLSGAGVMDWGKRVYAARSLGEAQALEAEAPVVAATAAAGLPRLWTKTVFTRVMNTANRLIAERGLDPAAIPVRGYAELMREAAGSVREADAPNAEAFKVAQTLAEAFVRIFEIVAGAPGAAFDTLRAALNSDDVRNWLAAAQAAVDLSEAQAHVVLAEKAALAAASRLPLYWAQGMPARLESALGALLLERALEAEKVPLGELGGLMREAAARLDGEVAAAAPSTEALEAARVVLEQQIRILEAVAAGAPDHAAMTQRAAFIMQYAFLPALGKAGTLAVLASAAAAAADKIIASLEAQKAAP
ncbi:MAG: hypothetical protein WC969_15150 [Elusimicrobiota bacterium]